MQKNGFIISVSVIIALSAACAVAGDLSVTVLTDESTGKLEGRVGTALDSTWEVGGMATWFAEDPDTDWSIGAWLKLAVDPNGSVPLANWLPQVGTWLDLPDTIAARTYLIGKGEFVPLDSGPQLSVSGGAGAQIGPLVIEWIYRVVEAGESEDPALSSGPELWFGGRLTF